MAGAVSPSEMKAVLEFLGRPGKES